MQPTALDDHPSENSVTHWITTLKTGDQSALEKLWRRYFHQLVRVAAANMTGFRCRAYDEEDAAISAFYSFCEGVDRDRFPRLNDRHNLWRILITLTRREIVTRHRYETSLKRGGGRTRGDSVFDEGNHESLADVLSEEPTPEFAASLTDEIRHLIGQLDHGLREVAELKMNGFTNREIAQKQGLTQRSVERKLERIRRQWNPPVSKRIRTPSCP